MWELKGGFEGGGGGGRGKPLERFSTSFVLSPFINFFGFILPNKKGSSRFSSPPFPPLPRGANQTVAPTIPCPENPIGVAFSTRK